MINVAKDIFLNRNEIHKRYRYYLLIVKYKRMIKELTIHIWLLLIKERNVTENWYMWHIIYSSEMYK